MADTKISQMPAASTLDGSETVAGLQNGENVQITTQDIADLAGGGGGGGYTELTGTLSAGNTTLTLSNVAITTSSVIDIYTDPIGVNYTSATVTTGQIVIVYPVQDSALKVIVRVS